MYSNSLGKAHWGGVAKPLTGISIKKSGSATSLDLKCIHNVILNCISCNIVPL